MKSLIIGLLSHVFQDSNLGCVALSICNVQLIDKAIYELGFTAKYVILVNERYTQIPLEFNNIEKIEYEYRVFSGTKQTIKHPIKLLKTHIFDDCDFVFNICAGDGFTDIYGTWRTFSETYMTLLSNKKGCPTVLAPQSIGPFSNVISKYLARITMNRCKAIFVRDHISYELCQEMGQMDKTVEVIDVALALPYTRKTLKDGFNLGINVSGLLYNNSKNRFDLRLDYRRFIEDIVDYSIKQGFNVHLISHVNIYTESGEDDYAACKEIHDRYPSTLLVPRFDSPIDAKSYIAGLDVFTGARMHATVAAVSSGVPVIPLAYSRKVNGLYGNLKYPYFIDAKAEKMNNGIAYNLFIEYLSMINAMKDALSISREIYSNGLNKYKDCLKTVILNSLEFE